MAVHSSALKQLGLLGMVAAMLTSVACTRQPEWRADQFVGRWKTSRLATRPIELHANGEWEIRSESGHEALQYGVWRLQDRRLIWTYRSDQGVLHDANHILNVSPVRFELRERDGSITRFDRVN